MAERTVKQRGEGAAVQRASELKDRAHRLIAEMRDECSKAYAVATAGRTLCADEITPRCLFETIEDILSDARLEQMLTQTVDELAALSEVHHG